MKRPLLLLFSFLIFSSNTIAQTIIQKNVYFDSDAHLVTSQSNAVLNSLESEVAAFKDFSIDIIGHTDQDGKSDYNIALSKRRAEQVKAYFLDQGVDASRISISYLGESQLANIASDASAKQENRRVEVRVEGFDYDTVDEMVSNVEAENNDHHTIDMRIESALLLKQGTEVKIPENAFCHLDGTPVEGNKVDMVFKEVFEYSDMVDERLFTQTEDRILETGGMIYIEARQNGKPLRLRDGKNIEMIFPEQEQKDGMELFFSAEDEDGVIWEETGTSISSQRNREDMPFISVDLSPILEYEMESTQLEALSFAPMPPFPHPLKKVYPPYKENYSEEGYQQALAKYDAAIEARRIDEITRPERVKEWLIEAERRKSILIEHKKKYVRSNMAGKLKERIARLRMDQDRISHDRLVKVLFAFLDDNIGRISYNDWHYAKLAFGSTAVDVRKQLGLELPDYKYATAGYLFPQFLDARKAVDAKIVDRMYEMGYIDEENISRYVVSTSQLGWINCDRFYELAQDQKTNLEFATLENDDEFYLIFKDLKSLIRPRKKDGKVVFIGVPKGEKVRLVAVNVNDGHANMAVHDFTIDVNKGTHLKYYPAGVKELRKALEI